MPVLLDNDIRKIFISHHEKRYPKTNLLSEVSINNGLAIADLVSMGIKTSHCYEIKSDKDKISRVLVQAKSYDIVFQKISLITTPSKCQKAIDIIPAYWGIIIVSKDPENKVSYVRKALPSPYFSEKKALQTLWRDELINIVTTKKIIEKSTSKLNRSVLIDSICDNLSSTEICKLVNDYMLARRKNLNRNGIIKLNPC